MSKQQKRVLLIGATVLIIAACTVAAMGSLYLAQRILVLRLRDSAEANTDLGNTGERPLSEQGLLVVALDPEGAAAKAGVRRGNIILGIDGNRVDRPQQLQRALQVYRAGDQLTLQVLDGPETREVLVTLGGQGGMLGLRVVGPGEQVVAPGAPARPPEIDPTPPPSPPEPFSPERSPVQPFQPVDRALVTGVVEASPAARAGLQAGDVITNIDGQAILSRQELVDAMRGFSPGDRVNLTVRRGDLTLSFRVRLATHPEDSSRGYIGVELSADPFSAPGFRGSPTE